MTRIFHSESQNNKLNVQSILTPRVSHNATLSSPLTSTLKVPLCVIMRCTEMSVNYKNNKGSNSTKLWCFHNFNVMARAQICSHYHSHGVPGVWNIPLTSHSQCQRTNKASALEWCGKRHYLMLWDENVLDWLVTQRFDTFVVVPLNDDAQSSGEQRHCSVFCHQMECDLQLWLGPLCLKLHGLQ